MPLLVAVAVVLTVEIVGVSVTAEQPVRASRVCRKEARAEGSKSSIVDRLPGLENMLLELFSGVDAATVLFTGSAPPEFLAVDEAERLVRNEIKSIAVDGSFFCSCLCGVC